MVKRICAVDGCDRELVPPYGRGMCNLHYQRWRKHGDPNHERPSGRTSCVIADCGGPNFGHGWCAKHYTRWRRHGSPTARVPGEVVDGKKICSRCAIDTPLGDFSRASDAWCRRCHADKRAEWRKANPDKLPKVQTNPRACDNCGTEFQANKRRKRYCSRECFESFRHKANWIHVVTRRARERDALVEIFDRAEIFERDNWICRICDQPIDRNRIRPHPDSPSIDHIIPIARGGVHARSNVQTAHLGCNVRKGVAMN